MSAVRLASIWAQDQARLLGSGTAMLWHVPADFAHFKASTMGCPVIMGRASWEALGRALPGRLNVVISTRPDYEAPGAVVVPTLEAALDVSREWAQANGADTIWITGGGRVYAQTMGLVDELVITDLDMSVEVAPGSPMVHAPVVDPRVWQVDPARSDADWREASGDARWKVTTWVRR